MKSAPRMAVAQLGARMHYAVPRIYQRADMLEQFFTDVCAEQGWPRLLKGIPHFLRPASLQRLLERIPEEIPPDRITTFPWFGLRYGLYRSGPKTPSEQTEIYLSGGRQFSELVARHGFCSSDGVYTFKLEALEIFQHARRQNQARFLEMPSVHRKVMHRLLNEEYRRYPAWDEPPESDSHLHDEIQRERAEWALADRIFCPSQFVVDSIQAGNGPVEKCSIVPYGVHVAGAPRSERPFERPLRVLTVGAVSLVKGSPYVLEAARKGGKAFRFRMVGSVNVPEAVQQDLARHVELVGAVPRSRVKEHYRWADVFLLPSICEGSATVTYEALANGLPIICTSNAGSIVRDGKEGFLIPIRDSEAIVEKLYRLRDDRALLENMSHAARKRYRTHGNLEAYARRLVKATRDFFT